MIDAGSLERDFTALPRKIGRSLANQKGEKYVWKFLLKVLILSEGTLNLGESRSGEGNISDNKRND